MSVTVAALYVLPDGPYVGLPDVEVWDEARDARLYAGPHPVVAHPPCQRWGRFWWAARHRGLGLGDDEGCFAAALASVRAWGGVLEHPEGSLAWPRFGLPVPGRQGRPWTRELFDRGYAVSVDQIRYGHRARKRTWLYYCSASSDASPPPPLDASPPPLDAPRVAVASSPWTRRENAKARAYVVSGPGVSATAESRMAHGIELMGRRECMETPVPFRDLLLGLARRSVGAPR